MQYIPIVSTVVDKVGDYFNKREDTRRTEIQGQIKKELIREEGKVKIDTIREQGKVDIKMKELSNERADKNEEHIRKMKEAEYKYKLDDKKEDHSHELNTNGKIKNGIHSYTKRIRY